MSTVESAPQSELESQTFKVIIVGDIGVGKTCLFSRFHNRTFPPGPPIATTAVDFRLRIFNESLKVVIWDTAGSERFRPIVLEKFDHSLDAVILVYDVTDRETFEYLAFWAEHFKKCGVGYNVPRILIGNKCDVECDDRVSTDETQKFANDNNMEFFETSAKSQSEADHVESIFLGLLHKIQKRKSIIWKSEQDWLILDTSTAAVSDK